MSLVIASPTGGTLQILGAVIIGTLDANGVFSQYASVSYKNPVRVATAVAGTLATSFANGQTVDGIVLATGDRILLKNQAAAATNGIYVVAASGAPSRASDFDDWAEIPGSVVGVLVGTANADTAWLCTSDSGGTIGSTAINFTQFGVGGATIVHTTNLIKGDGAGNGVDSTLAPEAVLVFGQTPTGSGVSQLIYCDADGVLRSSGPVFINSEGNLFLNLGIQGMVQARQFYMWNSGATFGATLHADPTANRDILVQDLDGTLAFLADIRYSESAQVQKGNGTGGFENAVPGTDFLAPGTLPNGTAAVTQAQGDIPAAVASCEYVDTAINDFRNNIASFAALMTAAGITPVANGTVTPVTSGTTNTGILTALS